MSEPTEQDRKTALNTWLANDHVEAIAQALADEREKARVPFLALADELDREMGTDVGVAIPSRTAWRIRRAAEAAQ